MYLRTCFYILQKINLEMNCYTVENTSTKVLYSVREIIRFRRKATPPPHRLLLNSGCFRFNRFFSSVNVAFRCSCRLTDKEALEISTFFFLFSFRASRMLSDRTRNCIINSDKNFFSKLSSYNAKQTTMQQYDLSLEVFSKFLKKTKYAATRICMCKYCKRWKISVANKSYT